MGKDLKAGFQLAKEEAHAHGATQFPQLGPELLERGGTVIDLTRPLFHGMPMWYGHQKMFIVTNQDHDGWRRAHKTDAGFYARNLIMSEHTGTHTDGINEYHESGPAVDEVPLSYYWGDAVVLDLSLIHI